MLERALAESLEHFDQRLAAGSRIYLASVLAQAGELERAEREAVTAVEGLGEAPPLCAYAHGVVAEAALARGAPERALGHARQAMTILESLGGIEEGESLVRLVHVGALEATGDHDGARVALAEAVSRLLARANHLQNPALRQSFLEGVPENARTLALAATWGIER